MEYWFSGNTVSKQVEIVPVTKNVYGQQGHLTSPDLPKNTLITGTRLQRTETEVAD